MKIINLNNRYKRYFLLQRNSYLSKSQQKIRKIFGRYLFTNFFVFFFNSIFKINKRLNKEFDIEFNQIINFLPKDVNYILDIGSGLGIIDIYLNNHFNNIPKFTLIDKTRLEKKVSYGFDSQGQFYNNFDLTLDFLKDNGIDRERINLIDVDSKEAVDKNFDIVISLLSMGYHYPINQYLDILTKHTHKNTIFIFDIADEYNNFDLISKMFESVRVIYKSQEIRHNYTRICCKCLK